ncbi:MAG: hypothetical protein B7X41_11395 [Microbacterium sp. 14-71-5]|nr:MAG: hypothetical protein B7X41_11395 [Microbacterium sp. 14-71-5]
MAGDEDPVLALEAVERVPVLWHLPVIVQRSGAQLGDDESADGHLLAYRRRGPVGDVMERRLGQDEQASRRLAVGP